MIPLVSADLEGATPAFGADYPCLGALAAQRGQGLEVRSYCGDSWLPELARDIGNFAEDRDSRCEELTSFVAIFPELHVPLTQPDRVLWEILRDLATHSPVAWPHDRPRRPEDPGFKFYFAGVPWFPVLLSPSATRRSRRFPHVAISFNDSRMFDRLRLRGHYDRMADKIRERDSAYSGEMYISAIELADLGDAPQYAGERFGHGWTCPVAFADAIQDVRVDQDHEKRE